MFNFKKNFPKKAFLFFQKKSFLKNVF